MLYFDDFFGASMNQLKPAISVGIFVASMAMCGCMGGPGTTGSFERTLTVSGPIHLEILNAAGDITINGSDDNVVHVHADVRVSRVGFGSAQTTLSAVLNLIRPSSRGPTDFDWPQHEARAQRAKISYVIRSAA